MTDRELARCLVIEQARSLVIVMAATTRDAIAEDSEVTYADVYAKIVNRREFTLALRNTLNAVEALQLLEKAEASK